MKFKIFLGLAFLAAWIWAAIGPVYPEQWLLENILVVLVVPFTIVVGRMLKLSNFSYALITVFMILHAIGSHYSYAEVPFGFTLQGWLDASRNMYDRLVHFLFGFILAYPLREAFMKASGVRGFWSYFFPVELVLAASAIYEIGEWMVAGRKGAIEALALLGTQGDIWDAQKDMFLAGLGAILAMLIICGVGRVLIKKDSPALR